MINVNNPIHLNRLQKAIQHSRRVLEPWRSNREKFIREFVGSRYSDEGSKYKKLVNLINQTVETYTVSLVANRPRVRVTSRYDTLKYFSKKYEIHLNNLIQEIRLEQTLREIALDAFFAMGIAKTFLGSTGNQIEVQNPDTYPGNPYNPVNESIWVDPGKPMVERISLDDWVHDTNATRWDKIKFEGDYYRIQFSKLKDPMFDQSVAKNLRPSRRHESHAEDESYDRASNITREQQSEWDEVVDMIDLADIYLPHEKKIVTIPRQLFRDSKPLAVRDWNGPENGPYRKLSYLEVPDNLMPSAPVQNIIDLEGLENSLLRKLERQAKRQKTIVGAPRDSKEDMERVKRQSDGGTVYLDDPAAIKEFSLGGIDQESLAFAIQINQLYNKAAGNPEAIAGLGAQSGTAAQDTMIQEAASRKLAKMQEQVVQFTEGIVRDLGWMLWVDAYKEQAGQIEIPDAGITLQDNWTPEEREGNFEQYLFSVEPESMPYKSSSMRAAQLRELLQTVYLPSLQMMMQQGGTIDWQELTQVLSELYDLPRLKDVVRFDQPPMQPEVSAQEAINIGAGPAAPKPQQETIRRNVSTGGTPQARDNVMMQTLLSNGNAPLNQEQESSVGGL